MKAFVDNKLNVTKMIISVFDKVEDIVGKGDIACTSNFSFSHNVFKRLLSQTRHKVSLCGEWVKLIKKTYAVVTHQNCNIETIVTSTLKPLLHRYSF